MMTVGAFTKTPITVLGAGSWGTALALVLSRNGNETRLWSPEKDHTEEMRREGLNKRYLPEHRFPKTLTIYDDLKESLEGVVDILIVVPSFAFQSVVEQLKPLVREGQRIAWGTKGLSDNGELFNDIIGSLLGPTWPVAVLSGPSLAVEVAAGLPTAVSLASNNKAFANDLITRLHCPHFRVYENKDFVGLELCGAVKNVLAIATGISDGLKLGSNARSALITRGLVEMKRLCLAMGGLQETIMGLAGLGDLVLTCTDNHSRNRRFGLALGSGIGREAAEKQIGQAIEGLYNVKNVYTLSKKHRIDMPITQQVYRIIHDSLDPKKAVQELLERAPKSE